MNWDKYGFVSLELLENKEFFIQKVSQRIKHGAKGKVLCKHILYDVAKKVIEENKEYCNL